MRIDKSTSAALLDCVGFVTQRSHDPFLRHIVLFGPGYNIVAVWTLVGVQIQARALLLDRVSVVAEQT